MREVGQSDKKRACSQARYVADENCPAALLAPFGETDHIVTFLTTQM